MFLPTIAPRILSLGWGVGRGNILITIAVGLRKEWTGIGAKQSGCWEATLGVWGLGDWTRREGMTWPRVADGEEGGETERVWRSVY